MTNKTIRFPVYIKITIIFTLITAVLLIGLYLSLRSNFREMAYSNIERRLEHEISLVRYMAEQQLPAMHADAFADRIGRALDLRVTVIDMTGRVIGDSQVPGQHLDQLEDHSTRPEVQQALAGEIGRSRRFSTTIQQNLLYMAETYSQPPQGIIRLAIPLIDIAQISRRLNKDLLGALAGVFFFTIIIAVIVSRWITRPLAEIVRGARRISVGNFGTRIMIKARDEIGDLARVFNDMSDQIRSRISDVSIEKSRLEAVFSSMMEGVLVIDRQGQILLLNDALRNLLHISNKAEGLRPLEVIRNADIQQMVTECQQKKGAVLSREVVFMREEERVLQVHGASVIREGESEGVVLVFHDITDMRHLEKVRRDFVANVSHELRTPIASIKGYAETLLDGALQDQENAEEFVRIIFADSDRLAKLVDDILALSAIESGKLIHEFGPCELEPLIDRVFQSVKVLAEARRVRLVKQGDFQDLIVHGDEMSLFRMLLNLVDNAVKYNSEGGTVTVSAFREGTRIILSVRDTGQGIPAEDQSRIFERFYRVDKAHSRQMGGTGLGLAIVKHIVQAHGGMISLESAPGEGSVFTADLPASDA
ncbi:MAG: two-component system histidine kinase PnpS [Candidatus Omnitrophota bacterium]